MILSTQGKDNTGNIIFLLLLALMTNFIPQTLNCSVREIMENNMIVKQFVIFFLIYFSLAYRSGSFDNPIRHLKHSLQIQFLFLAVTHQKPFWFFYGLFILGIGYILQHYIEYQRKTYGLNINELGTNGSSKVGDIFWVLDKLKYVAIASLVIGNIDFLMYSINRHSSIKDFSIFEYIFGTSVCDF